MLIKLLKKLLGGVAAGLGFTFALVAVFWLLGGMMIGKMSEDAYSELEVRVSNDGGYRKFDEKAGLGVKSHSDRKTENRVEILAQIENNGDATWSHISLEVEFFDAQNRFLDECSKFLQGHLAPGQIENVKIGCGGCSGSTVEQYATYAVKIVDASLF